jgi:RNA polymerase sigma-54 factor
MSTLYKLILAALSASEVSPELRRCVDILAARVDEDGYIMQPLSQISREEAISEESLSSALILLQRISPPGVGARSLPECLLLQLPAEAPRRDVLDELIKNHLIDLQAGRLDSVAAITGFDAAAISAAVQSLKSLDPAPGRNVRGNDRNKGDGSQ